MSDFSLVPEGSKIHFKLFDDNGVLQTVVADAGVVYKASETIRNMIQDGVLEEMDGVYELSLFEGEKNDDNVTLDALNVCILYANAKYGSNPSFAEQWVRETQSVPFESGVQKFIQGSIAKTINNFDNGMRYQETQGMRMLGEETFEDLLYGEKGNVDPLAESKPLYLAAVSDFFDAQAA